MARFCYEPPTESCRLVSALCRPGGSLLVAFSLPCASWTQSMHNSIHTRPARLSNLSSINHFEMEARVGIEPTNTAFAEPCLTTWRPRLHLLQSKSMSLPVQRKFRFFMLLPCQWLVSQAISVWP